MAVIKRKVIEKVENIQPTFESQPELDEIDVSSKEPEKISPTFKEENKIEKLEKKLLNLTRFCILLLIILTTFCFITFGKCIKNSKESQKHVDHYRALNIPPRATPHDILGSYRSILNGFDPSIGFKNLKKKSFKELENAFKAYLVLVDPQKRSEYNKRMNIVYKDNTASYIAWAFKIFCWILVFRIIYLYLENVVVAFVVINLVIVSIVINIIQ